MKFLLLCLAFFAGAATSLQVPVNAGLRSHLQHPMQATFVSFAVGMVVSLAYCMAVGSPVPSWDGLSRVPWWCWCGGLLGALYVGSSIVLSPKIGVAAMLSMVIAGQMLASVLIDHYGVASAPIYSISTPRVLGAILVIIGATVMAAWK